METQIKRGQYNEIVSMPTDAKAKCEALLNGVKKAAKIDEHGGWDFGILESNYKKGQIHSMNYDFYAFGNDVHDGGFLAVIQVREYYKAKSSYWPEIRKSYFLLGNNEDGSFFAHPVQSQVIHNAVKKGKDVVLQVQTWIFQHDYEKVVRQGDLCLIPVRSVKGVEIENRKIIEGSHSLAATKIYENGDLYVVNPHLVHLPGTHPTVDIAGKYKLVVGKRAKYWSFAKPTLD